MSQENTVKNVVENTEEGTMENTESTVENTTGAVTEQKPTKEEFEALLNEGRKAFLLQNYSVAAEKLSQAAVLS
jgi:hypothetical protein